jgi:hypothetical protein
MLDDIDLPLERAFRVEGVGSVHDHRGPATAPWRTESPQLQNSRQ